MLMGVGASVISSLLLVMSPFGDPFRWTYRYTFSYGVHTAPFGDPVLSGFAHGPQMASPG